MLSYLSGWKDLLEARVMLEAALAGLAALRASEAEIKNVGDAIETMRTSTSISGRLT